ncbi:MAG TPA: glycosyl hydrolase, partial [Cytophagales bacterium]|nr:glycosyl hydrolase [Cytophagales bacterium]
QYLHETTDGGQSWTTISPDLTRNDSAKGAASGGPITKDNTGVEYYSTIFAVEESPSEEGTIWVGSDDGRLHITRDGGDNWEEITPPGAPTWLMWNCIDANPHKAGGAYVAGTLYKGGDFAPYLYKTEDYGKTWTKIVSGIESEHFTRAIRADEKREGLLYAGTEAGMYISFDDGASWKSFQMNLPTVPITDLAIKNDNLIAATQGRSFWMIDDLTPLHQLSADIASSEQHLFEPMPSYRMGGFQGRPSLTEGANHPGGVMVHYYLKEVPDSTVTLEFMEMDGDLIARYTTKPEKGSDDRELDDLEAGMNRLVWNMRYPGAERFDGLIMWAAGTAGPMAAPGDYKVKMTVGDWSQEQMFEIVADPRSETDQAGYQAQFDYLIAVRDKVTETHQAIKDIRSTRNDMTRVSEMLKDRDDAEDILDMVKEINESISVIEKELYQTKNRSGQDPLNYPIRLNNKLAALGSQVGYGNYPPTDQAEAFRKEVTELIDAQLAEWYKVRDTQVPELNNRIKDLRVDYISVPDREDEGS